MTLYEEDVKPGLSFKSKEIAMKSLKFFFTDHYHPCVVTSNGVQRMNFTGCKCGLNINEQKDGSWKVGAKVILDHTGHEIGHDIFATYSFTKKLSKDDIDFIILLAKSKAPVRKTITSQKMSGMF